jgi:hypothetical protein
VCFGSLTKLLQYVDLKTAFRFLHVMTRQVKQVGAVAHFHIAPDAHDEQTLATIQSLFDRIVDGRTNESMSFTNTVRNEPEVVTCRPDIMGGATREATGWEQATRRTVCQTSAGAQPRPMSTSGVKP